MLYIGVVADRKRRLDAELAQMDSEMGRMENEIARIQRDIAINTRCMDWYSKRLSALRRAIGLAQEDAADEENEEMATLRLIRACAFQE
ncbi:hypothetical protein WT83_16440 [Burkholderia territorii]|uniref:Uncharacterized protein n=2 Tax=Burkholderia territorii TaxID=1503055 RepID=A0A108EP58_9BURK|nr:hypothetical protein WT83_16440 [Burkholderia territorii]